MKKYESVWDKVDSIHKELAAPTPPPKQGFTVTQYAERYKICRRSASNRISVLVAIGKLKQIGTNGRHGAKVFDVV